MFPRRDGSVSIQTRNLRVFLSEIFKDSKGIAPNVFPNILIPIPPESSSSNYRSGFQLKPSKISI